MDEWIKKIWHIPIMEYYSVLKKGDFAACKNMEETEGHYTP